MSRLPSYDKRKLYKFRLHKTVICIAIWIAVLIIAFVTASEFHETWVDWLYPITVWTMLCVALWLISIYGWLVLRLLPYQWFCKNRIVHLVLIVTFIAGLNQLCIDMKWLSWIPMLLVIVCSAIVLTHHPTGKMSKLVNAFVRFFGKGENIRITRAKIIRLLSPYVVFFWIIFLISNYLLVRTLSGVEVDLLDNRPELPLANESVYQSIVHKIDVSHIDQKSSWREVERSDVIGYLPVVTPQDLPTILDNLKKSKPAITDSELLRVMKRCGRDVYDILLDSLENPEAEEALIARAEMGDFTVKKNLEELFREKLRGPSAENATKAVRGTRRRYRQSIRNLGDCFDITSALATVSVPQETMNRLLDILGSIDPNDLKEDDFLSPAYYFYSSLDCLPRPEGTTVLKAYLNKTDYYDLSAKRNLSDLADALILFADADLAEEIFLRTSQTPLIGKPIDLNINIVGVSEDMKNELTKPRNMAPKIWKSISPYFENTSIHLLKKELATDNADLRAYLVWQLTRLGYEWSDPELEKLLVDIDWRVRLNTLFIIKKKSVQLALNDENPIVKTLAKLLVESN